ncbi:TPA: DNA sulfur modification protein DndD [Salmonella enterica]|uniref:DNA sulfur modification protein DndD n=2 Tax=Salmonella enterica TaxID=28901 RepID=A0A737Y4U4_SALER|nr:DNA sulfur modification protein DndD [Salmonella enterica]EAV3186176.1 DNA sulfur modification protein DndD [Salmonella enterica subsp. enterica]ECT9716784.1 DNA sulfur modification protein DndD [Salmonella enterica subsp. diarizonae str. CFSAN000553]HAE8613042.1 DNA sulfur modification protein DndD [Salmonella enterica subsp. salamae serovar 30:1,z28:z6]HAF0276034.1 DNA sulfur modification protein DndD [Salmonella enterica subsp. diarizonae serovar 38:[k]:z35:-]EAA8388914.1 DNA sulfur modi
MLIKQLVLHNFRVFNGTHTIDLAPRKRQHEVNSRPIVLFGGLNGAGKTSILSAIRLALYGRLAFGSAMQQQEYIEQLGMLVHNGTCTKERPNEASVELTFTYNKDGREAEFTVTRSWRKGKKDRLSLQQDGQPRSELNYDQCQGFLNELIPHGVADLFFFDGEKIAELAEDESGNILRTAVRRLLGLDLIAKLQNDLMIFVKRQQTSQLAGSQQQQVAELETQIKEFKRQTEKSLEEADFVSSRIESLSDDIMRHEGLLNAQGGAFAQTKAQEKQKVETLLKEKERLEKALRQECDGSLPYALAPNTLSRLLEKLADEVQIKQAKSFEKELEQFLAQLQKDITFRSSSESSTKKITAEVITENLTAYVAAKPKGDLLFDISERETGMLQQAVKLDSQGAWKRFDLYRNQLADIEQQLEQAAANIARAPEDDQLMDLFTKLRDLDHQREKQRHKYRLLLEKAKQTKQLQLDCVRQVQKAHDTARSHHGFSSALKNAEETIRLLDYYSDVLTQARVKKLSSNFESAYHKLARKEDLQLNAHINPQTFDVELIDENGSVINRKLLSAGEKQIYAIAILEALAKTSGRDFPVIIDTPLGRLDSQHRDKLINHYFPEASHQVVLLSTDTEVDERYFIDRLRDDISHAYEIVFNAYTKSSSLKPGYFWELTKEAI